MALAAACSSKPPSPPPVLSPPLVELADFGMLGMIDFAVAGSDGLAPLASQEFLASLQSAQPGTAVLELGTRERVLAAVGGGAIDPETVRAIGEKYRVDAILVGEVQAREVHPRVSIRELGSLTASAELEGVLNARILETGRGATLWTASAQSRAPLARVEVGSWGLPSLDAEAPEKARRELVRELVEQATADFQPRWVNP